MIRVVAGTIVVALGVAGCESPTAPSSYLEEAVPDVSEFVTAELRGELTPSGRFANSWRCPETFGSPRSLDSALELAAQIARLYLSAQSSPIGEPLGPAISDQHGHEIDWANAEVNSRATACAEPFVEPLPDTLHPSVANHYGPTYLVPTYVGSDNVAVISVAAMSNLSVGPDGLQDYHGNEVRVGTSPHGHPTGAPLSAEAAVKFGALSTGTKIRRLPRLLKPGHNVVAHQAKWELGLDQPVRCSRITDGSIWDVNTLYVGLYPSFIDWVPRTDMPPRLFVRDTVPPEEVPVRIVDVHGNFSVIDWPVREGVAVNYWEVQC